MPDWTRVLFPESATSAPAAPSRAAPPQRSSIVQRIHQEAVRQGVDPQLAQAVATQESYLNPNAVGDRGKSLGLFQLQRAAALDAGIDPDRRGEVGENIRGGVSYLKQKLQQSGGNVEQALSRYNRGTPTYRGIGDPHYVENVMRHYQRHGGSPPLLERVRGQRRPAQRTAAAPAPTDWARLLFPEGTAPQPASPPPEPAAPAEPAGKAVAPDREPIDWAAVLFGTG